MYIGADQNAEEDGGEVRINTGKAFACRIQGCKGEQYIHP
jgi:hypothetical protein